MNELTKSLFTLNDEKKARIQWLLPAALSNIPFHENTPAITRYFAADFPVYLAVHEVSPVVIPPAEYTQPHIHNDFDEVNMIISRDSLLYKVQLGAEVHTINNNCGIWIPRGTLHAANVVWGSGYFITIQLNKQ